MSSLSTTSAFAKPNTTGKTFALVLLVHVALLWLAQAVWTSEPVRVAREVVSAQLIQSLREPDQPKAQPQTPPELPKLPVPTVPKAVPQPTPALPSQPVAAPSPAPSSLPAITAAPAAPAPAVPSAAAPSAPAAAPAAPSRPSMTTAATRATNSCAEPPYPPISLRLQEEGVVRLKLLIGENGQVLKGQIDKSSGYKRLDDAALAGLSLCKFKPATIDGKPIQEWLPLTYRWELNQ